MKKTGVMQINRDFFLDFGTLYRDFFRLFATGCEDMTVSRNLRPIVIDIITYVTPEKGRYLTLKVTFFASKCYFS